VKTPQDAPRSARIKPEESLISPGLNPTAYYWLIVIGLPLLMLFLVLQKQQEHHSLQLQQQVSTPSHTVHPSDVMPKLMQKP
jgi:hypothetical protein